MGYVQQIQQQKTTQKNSQTLVKSLKTLAKPILLLRTLQRLFNRPRLRSDYGTRKPQKKFASLHLFMSPAGGHSGL